MNVGDIKTPQGDRAPVTNPNLETKARLQEEGLRQAASVQSSSSAIVSGSLSSQTTVGLRVFNSSLSSSVELNRQTANLPEPPKESEKGLFDFEEIARNVLRFVGGTIRATAAGGGDEETLRSLFDQAREGVSRGVDLARRDLGGLLNDDISNGINNAQGRIEDGIQDLEREIFGEPDAEESLQAASVSESISIQTRNAGDINIRTRDGDEVSISFEDLRALAINQQVTAASAQRREEDGSESQFVGIQAQQSLQQFERSGVSFSVQGELDEDELNAIGELVGNVQELATDFFDGDVEAAFDAALELGFDEQELTGFALQLTRQEQIQVIQTYENVSLYNQQEPQTERGSSRAVEPVSQYLDRLLNVQEGSNRLLELPNSYDELVNGLLRRIEDVGTEDILQAINRFNNFNNRLLDNLPQQAEAEAQPEPEPEVRPEDTQAS